METKSVKSFAHSFVQCGDLKQEVSLASQEFSLRNSMGQIFRSDSLAMLSNSDYMSRLDRRRRSIEQAPKEQYPNHDLVSLNNSGYMRDHARSMHINQPNDYMSFLGLSNYGLQKQIPLKEEELKDEIFNINEQQVPDVPPEKKTTSSAIITRKEAFQMDNKDTISNKSSKSPKKKKRVSKEYKNNTKNLLRNYAQNAHEYMRYNRRATKYLDQLIKSHMNEPQFKDKSEEWIKKQFLKYVNQRVNYMKSFTHYQEEWQSSSPFAYFYRYLTLKFYVDESPCYFYKTKLADKALHVQYLPYFVFGVFNPTKFNRFK